MTIGSKQKCVHVPYFLFKLFGEIGLFFYLRKGLFGGGYIDPFSSPSRWLLPFKHPLAPWHCWYKQCPIASERKGWAAMGPAPASFGNVAGFFVIWWYPKFIKDHHKFTTYYSLEAKKTKPTEIMLFHSPPLQSCCMSLQWMMMNVKLQHITTHHSNNGWFAPIYVSNNSLPMSVQW